MLDKITYDVRGIVWLTDKPLAEFPQYFNELDYLFDGLIAQSVCHGQKPTEQFEKNIFSGQSFNRDLLLVQIFCDDKNRLEKDLIDALNLIPGKGDYPNVLVLGEKSQSFSEKSLKKKLDIRFIHLNELLSPSS